MIKIYKITQNLFYFLNEEGKNMNNLYLIKIDIIKVTARLPNSKVDFECFKEIHSSLLHHPNYKLSLKKRLHENKCAAPIPDLRLERKEIPSKIDLKNESLKS